MTRLKFALVSAAVIAMATAFAPLAPAQTDDTDDPADVAALNAEAQQLDPADYPFVQAVCTVCHSPAMFLHVHSWEEWQGLFNDMISYGASGTQEQWDHIDKYFLQTMSFIDINKAREDELMGVLQVDEKTAIAIVQRQPLHSAAELKAVPGVNAAVVDNLDANARLNF